MLISKKYIKSIYLASGVKIIEKMRTREKTREIVMQTVLNTFEKVVI